MHPKWREKRSQKATITHDSPNLLASIIQTDDKMQNGLI